MPAGLILASALWCRYCYGVGPKGQVIAPNDPNWEMLTTTARAAKQNPAKWIGMRAIYGDLADDPAPVAAFAEALNLVWEAEIGMAITRYLEGWTVRCTPVGICRTRCNGPRRR